MNFHLATLNIRDVWKNILPHCSNDFVDFESQVEKVVENIVQIRKELGFQNVDNEIVHDCINSHSGELDNETIVETDQQRAYEEIAEKEEGIDDPVEIKEFNIADMEKIFALYDEASTIIMNGDPNIKHSIPVHNNVERDSMLQRTLCL